MTEVLKEDRETELARPYVQTCVSRDMKFSLIHALQV